MEEEAEVSWPVESWRLEWSGPGLASVAAPAARRIQLWSNTATSVTPVSPLSPLPDSSQTPIEFTKYKSNHRMRLSTNFRRNHQQRNPVVLKCQISCSSWRCLRYSQLLCAAPPGSGCRRWWEDWRRTGSSSPLRPPSLVRPPVVAAAGPPVISGLHLTISQHINLQQARVTQLRHHTNNKLATIYQNLNKNIYSLLSPWTFHSEDCWHQHHLIDKVGPRDLDEVFQLDNRES